MADRTGLGDARDEETCARVEQLTYLIDELTDLRGKDRRLDAHIAAIVSPNTRGWQDGYEAVRLADAVAECLADGTDDQYDWLGSIAEIYDIAELTYDFDAAEALLPDSIPYTLHRLADGSCAVFLTDAPNPGEMPDGMGVKPAIAMLVAVLRTLLAKEGVL